MTQANQTTTQPRYPRRPGFTGAAPTGNAAPPAAAPPVAAPSAGSAPEPPQERISPNGRKMVTRESPVMVEFKAHGDFIEGYLVSAMKIQITDKQTRRPKNVMEYVFRSPDGGSSKCLGSYDIDTKLSPSDVGCWTEIAYKDDKQVTNGKMKVFDVTVEEKSTGQFSDGTQITDEDIPF